jgi:hypothetical protein
MRNNRAHRKSQALIKSNNFMVLLQKEFLQDMEKALQR